MRNEDIKIFKFYVVAWSEVLIVVLRTLFITFAEQKSSAKGLIKNSDIDLESKLGLGCAKLKSV